MVMCKIIYVLSDRPECVKFFVQMIKFHDDKSAYIDCDRDPYKADLDRCQGGSSLCCCISYISANFQDHTEKCGTNTVTDLVTEAAGAVTSPSVRYPVFHSP